MPACDTHATDEDRKIGAAANAAWNEGFSAAYRSRDAELVRLQRRVTELEAQLEQRLMRMEIDGDQIVEVDGRYAYRWHGDPLLQVGDSVVLPASWASGFYQQPGPRTGTVTRLASTYQGTLAFILRKA